MNREEVDVFEKVVGQLDGLHNEISIMAKKSSNDAVNPFKMKFINAVLAQCNQILGNKYVPFPDFQQFNSDELPSNSDITFMLAQYLKAAEKFRADNIYEGDFGKWYWRASEKGVAIQTQPPRKLKD